MADTYYASQHQSRGDEDKTISFETGKLAGLADGAVLAGIGNTRILVTATAADHVREGIDFFPLTVDIEERMYAAGKIPGSFFRREGRAPESAILTCRLIDRPLRPSFPSDFRNEVHVVGTVFGADQVNPYDVLAINARLRRADASRASRSSGPIGAVRLAYSTDGEWIAHPTYEEGDERPSRSSWPAVELDSGDVAVMMVEAGGTEKSWEYYYENGAPKVDEAALAAALEASKPPIKEVIALQRQLVDAVSPPTAPIEPMSYTAQVDYTPAIDAAVKDLPATAWSRSCRSPTRPSAPRPRAPCVPRPSTHRARPVRAAIEQENGATDDAAIAAGHEADQGLVPFARQGHGPFARIVKDGQRIDGRGTRDLRAAVRRGRRPADRARHPASSSVVRRRSSTSARSAWRRWTR